MPETKRFDESTKTPQAGPCLLCFRLTFSSLFLFVALSASVIFSRAVFASNVQSGGRPVTLNMSNTDLSGNSGLCDIAKLTLNRHFGGPHADEDIETFATSLPVPEKYKHSSGLFITISENGHTRACWGALEPHYSNLVKATVYTTEQALTDEYRFSQIKASELPYLHVQVTVVNKIEPISNIAQQNPRLCGMLVKSGGKAGVMLPGETTDPYYQMLKCKLKAGIQPGEPCLVYRIKADVNK